MSALRFVAFKMSPRGSTPQADGSEPPVELEKVITQHSSLELLGARACSRHSLAELEDALRNRTGRALVAWPNRKPNEIFAESVDRKIGVRAKREQKANDRGRADSLMWTGDPHSHDGVQRVSAGNRSERDASVNRWRRNPLEDEHWLVAELGPEGSASKRRGGGRKHSYIRIRECLDSGKLMTTNGRECSLPMLRCPRVLEPRFHGSPPILFRKCPFGPLASTLHSALHTTKTGEVNRGSVHDWMSPFEVRICLR